MPLDVVHDAPWTRRHDDPRTNLIARAPTIAYPTSLQELVDLCRDRPPEVRLKAAGSHWALSESALSDHTFVETHDPRNVHRAMGRTLHEVVPGCLHPDLLQRMVDPSFPTTYGTLVHIEAGKRIYQAYAELDQTDDLSDPTTLAAVMKDRGGDHFRGPWGFETLGGAGGQTVVGAFSTGTHGGDFDRGPLADSVVAVHLVADGGDHYWIERPDERYHPQLTDDDKLNHLYSEGDLSGPGYGFHVVRDAAVFAAVLVSCGRFGILYSAVLRAVPQYSLWERRRLHVWQDVRGQVKQRSGPLFTDTAVEAPNSPQRFLQVVVCLTPHLNFQRNLVGVTKRWQIPLSQAPGGPDQRVGDVLVDPVTSLRIGGPVFSKAGASFPYSWDQNDPYKGEEPGFLDRACANASFLAGIIDEVIREIEEFVASNGAVVGAGIAAVAAVGGGALILLIPALAIVLLVLKEILENFDADDRLGEHMEGIKNELLDPDEPDPQKRAAGLFAWQLLAYKIFELMQGDAQFGARSYAVMDRKNYLDRSCEWNVESVEVFFDAADDRLIAFIDALIAFEIRQELRGKAFLGYASIRFTGPTRATIGMQRYATTASVEVAGLADLSGSRDLVEYATGLALNPNMGGILHWGQRNTASATDVERLFGAGPAGNPLADWRAALATITAGSDGFSSDFTRRTGLEP